MTERVCNFGANRSLLGILARPDKKEATELPTVLLLNAGLLHHVGQNRLNVTLARRLTSLGYQSFRFDFSGQGDSHAQPSSLAVRERQIAEVREAMDYLEQTTAACRFVLIGLCTGADNAHRSAVADPRVEGIVMLDGYSYVTAGYIVRRFWRKILSPKSWINFLRQKIVQRQLGKGAANVEVEADRSNFWVLPQKSSAVNDVKSLVARGVRQLQVFTGSNIGYNYEEQYVEAMREVKFGELLKVVYAEQSDHTFSRCTDRSSLICEITEWLQSGFRQDQPNSH